MLLRIPFVWEGNPLYPLPPDYDELSRDGQRLARINAARQWMIPMGDLPVYQGFTANDMRGDAAVASHHFFKSYYLLPDPSDDFDPYFYDDTPLASPDMHHDLIRIWAMHRLSLTIAPRGSAKTTVGKEDIIRRLITAPKYSMVYCTLVHGTAMARSEQIREQAYHNRRLNDDFGPEYGGPLRPSKSEARTGVESWSLRNHASLLPMSIEARIRGIRPRRIRFDDPENDEKASTSMVNAREHMERIIFRVIMSMVLLRGAGLDWTATHVSKRHYSWHAMSNIETPEGLRSKDPRFDQWAKYHIKQLRLNPKTNLYESCWPAAWPVNEEEKLKLNLDPDTLTVADIRRNMGERAWLAEMQGQPGDSTERCFPLIAEHEDQFTWEFTNVDQALQDSPSHSSASITFLRKDVADTYTRITIPLRTLLGRGRLFACADYSYTSGPDSDYKTGVVKLHDPVTNILFVLDVWAAQCTKDAALKALFTLCNKWRVPQLYIETVKGSIAFYTELADLVRTKSPRHMGLDHFPAVKALKVGTEPKESKIASLSFRFEHRLIKLPLWRQTEPAVAMLLAQIEGFNPEVAGGGLDHDDCFPAETPILTTHGWIPISEVTTNHYVLTRHGPRRVLRTWCTGEKDLIERFGLVATANHPVWTENRGWTPLDSLRHDDIVMSCPHHTARPLLSTAANITVIQTPRGPTSETTTGPTTPSKGTLDPSTATCGSSPTDPSPQVCTSTTETGTLSTTPSRTSKPSPQTSTGLDTKRSEPQGEDQDDNSPSSPTCGIREPSLTSCVKAVAVSTKPSTPGGITTAPRSATPPRRNGDKQIEPSATRRPDCGGPSTQRSPEPRSSVTVIARRPTWNLTIDEHPEFFANGVLVHNCLDTVAMSKFVLKGRRAEAGAPGLAQNLKHPHVRLLEGEIRTARGTDLGMALDLSAVPASDLLALIDSRDQKGDRNESCI